jgi:ABC-2 type transport system permease protein
MTVLETARPNPSTLRQCWVLTIRMITPTLRNGELLTLIAAAIMFTAGFYIPLKQIMGAFVEGMSSYAQYLMPLITLTAPLTPLTARMSATMYRCAVALTVSVVCGHVIGFRFYGGVAHTVGFCLLVLLIGVALSLVGDLIGAAIENPEATMPLMMLPQLIFGFLSVGVEPVERFPEWIQPFVRDQPISQFVYALRALAGDSTPAAGAATWSVIGPALAWAVGLIVLAIPLHALVARRRR